MRIKYLLVRRVFSFSISFANRQQPKIQKEIISFLFKITVYLYSYRLEYFIKKLTLEHDVIQVLEFERGFFFLRSLFIT